MPELPEVERARKLIEETCTGYKIAQVETKEDKIVYTGGTDHEEFARELKGRTITGCKRKGKTFWMTLSGEGRMPVMHFGMTGMVQLKGQEPTWYRRRPRENPKTWPPKYSKFVLDLEPQEGSVGSEPISIAFLDSRRLGRLRLVPEPVEEQKPVSALGFDPMLNMPDLDTFKGLLKRKKGTIKGVIMDQAFSAGVGNWVADEILYQARLHPACPVPYLSEDDIIRLHHWIRKVPEIAVNVNADSRLFPQDWLFRWRWSKGRKQRNRIKKAGLDNVEVGEGKSESEGEGEGEEGSGEEELESEEGVGEGEEEEGKVDVPMKGSEYFALPNGKPATITFIEVGGRTTAVVAELQKMPEGVEIKAKVPRPKKGERTLSSTPKKLSEIAIRRRGKKQKVQVEGEGSSELSEEDDMKVKVEVMPKVVKRGKKAAAIVRGEVMDVNITEVVEETESKPPVKVSKKSKKAQISTEETQVDVKPVIPTPKSSRKGKRPAGDNGDTATGRQLNRVKQSRRSSPPKRDLSSELSDILSD